jgi:hypothetical protein
MYYESRDIADSSKLFQPDLAQASRKEPFKIINETFAKRPLLPNFCACPVKCEAYFSGVRLNILHAVKL